MSKIIPRQTSFTNLFIKVEYEDGIEIYDLWDVYEVVAQYRGQAEYYRTYIVPEKTKVTQISERFYQTPTLWWFILLYNDIVDPFSATHPETIIESDVELNIIRSEFLPEIMMAIREVKLKNE